MSKSNLIKLFSVLLAVCLCVTTVAFGTSAQNETDVIQNNVSDSASDTSLIKYLPPDLGNIIHIYWTEINGADKEAAKAHIAKDMGVNGSNGLRLGAEGIAVSYYETSLKFDKIGSLEADTEYTVSVKFKKESGEITKFKIGMLDNGANAKFIYKKEFAAIEITDEWTTVEFDYTPTYTVAGQWSSVAFNMATGTDGGSVIIDDLTVYKKSDENKTNIFTKGNFDGNVRYGTYVESGNGNTNYLPVTVPFGTEFPYIYWTGLTGDDKESAKVRIAKGEGVNGSNGVRIGAEGLNISYYETTFKFPATSVLEEGTKYIVSIKVKKDAGEISHLKLGVLDNGANASINYACALTEEYINSDWTVFEWEYTPTYEVEGQWSSIAFNLKTSANGGVVLIDDILVCRADDKERKNLFTKGSFDLDVKINTAEETVTEVSEYLPFDLSGSATHIYWTGLEGEEKERARPRSVAGVGFNKTAAMRLGAENIAITYYEASVKFPVLSSLKKDTEYTVKFKVKKDSGEITNLKAGVLDNGTDAKIIYACELTNEYLGDTWAEFEFRYTPTYEVEKQWSSVAFNIVTGEMGGSLLIDDIVVYESGDETKTNIFDYGSFDSDCKAYEVTETENNQKIVPVEIFDYTDKKQSDRSSDLPRYYWNDNYRNETRPQSVRNGVNGTYAMQIGGNSGPINYYSIGMYFPNRGTWLNNTEYEVSVKIKRTQGSVTHFKMGYNDPDSHNVVTLSDEYLSSDWTEYVWRFTTSDITNDPKSDNVITFEYKAPEGGATILIDDLKVYKAADGQKNNIFYKGSFEYVDGGQEAVDWDTAPSDSVVPVFNSEYNKDYSENGVIAKVVNCDTPSGDYALALGFDPEKPTNNEVYLMLASTRSGASYKIGFWAKVVGDVYNAQVGMIEGDYSFQSCGDGYSFNKYEHGKWTYHEFIVSDTGSFITNKSYRRFCVRFNAPAGSGMLIDGVTVKDAYHEDPLDYMYYGDFEKSTVIPEVDWSDDRFIYKEGR